MCHENHHTNDQLSAEANRVWYVAEQGVMGILDTWAIKIPLSHLSILVGWQVSLYNTQ